MVRDRFELFWLATGLATAAVVAATVGAATRGGTTPETAFLGATALLVVVSGALLVSAFSPAVTVSFGIVLTIFSGHWDQFGSPIGIDRVILICGIGIALLRDLRSPEPRLRTRSIHFILAAIAAYAVMSALFSGRLLQNDAFFGLLDNLGLIPFALFWAAPAIFPSASERGVLLVALVGTGLYLGTTAVLETTGPTWLVRPSYIMDPSVGLHFGRARGPFTEAAANGLSMFFAAVAGAMAIRRWKHGWIGGLCILLCAVGILFTLTRQVWLASIIGTGVAMVATPALRRFLLPTAMVGIVGVILVFAVVPGFNTKAQTRVDSKLPIWDRLNSNAAALKMTETSPLLGRGWFAFGTQSVDFYRLGKDRPLTTVGRPHNIFLSNAAELGVIVTLVWIGTLLWAFATGVRLRGPPELDVWRVGLIPVAIAWAVVGNFTPMSYAFDHALLWLWLGIAWSRT